MRQFTVDRDEFKYRPLDLEPILEVHTITVPLNAYVPRSGPLRIAHVRHTYGRDKKLKPMQEKLVMLMKTQSSYRRRWPLLWRGPHSAHEDPVILPELLIVLWNDCMILLMYSRSSYRRSWQFSCRTAMCSETPGYPTGGSYHSGQGLLYYKHSRG
jgi:hypothetical protein